MPHATNYLESKILNHLLVGVSYARPTHLYIGLSTADPTEGATGIAEPVGGAYGRVEYDNWSTSSGGSNVVNNAAIEFPEATASWGTINYFFIADASSGGNILFYNALTTPKVVNSGEIPRFKAGDLVIGAD